MTVPLPRITTATQAAEWVTKAGQVSVFFFFFPQVPILIYLENMVQSKKDSTISLALTSAEIGQSYRGL